MITLLFMAFTLAIVEVVRLLVETTPEPTAPPLPPSSDTDEDTDNLPFGPVSRD